jgi:hypothetical protein
VSLPGSAVVDLTLLGRRVVSVSATGRHVAVSGLTAPETGGFSHFARQVYLVDREGATESVTGAHGVLSGDGRYLAFATYLPGPKTIKLFDRQMQTTVDIPPPAGSNASECGFPAISNDARWIAFECARQPDNLGFSRTAKVYLHDRQAGSTLAIYAAPGNALLPGRGFIGDLSADGRYLVFNTTNQLTGHSVAGNQVFRYDRLSASLELLSRSTIDEVRGLISYVPAISADGSVVAFASAATHLVAGDANSADDILIVDASCTFEMNGISVPLPAAGGLATVSVSTRDDCAWVAASPAPWTTLTTSSGVAGATGSAVLTITAPINLTATTRSAAMNVAGRTVTVTQPSGCGPTLALERPVAPATAAANISAGLLTVNNPSCTWTVTSDAPWLTAATFRTGSGAVFFGVAANPAAEPRSGTLTVAGIPVTVTQAGTACSTSLSSAELSLPPIATSATIQVSAPPGCPWANSSAYPWIALTPLFGVGPGAATLQVSANNTGAQRAAFVTIGGLPLSVMQVAETGLTHPPGPPTDLIASVANQMVTLQWDAPSYGSAPTSYTIAAGAGPGQSNLVVLQTGNVNRTFTVQAPNGIYYVRVWATSPYGTSPTSNEVVVQVGCIAPPAPPAGLTQSSSGGVVSLAWGAAAGADGYFVHAGSAPGLANLAVLAVSGTALQTPAPPGTYFVHVRALNACGLSGASNEVALVVSPPSPPGPPSNLLSSVADNTVTLSWTTPVSGSPATGYLIEAGSHSGLANLAQVSVDSSRHFSTMGVPPGTYFVRVRATGAAGVSSPSNEVVVVVPD